MKASELLLQSAEPFDQACMMVREMELEIDRLRILIADIKTWGVNAAFPHGKSMKAFDAWLEHQEPGALAGDSLAVARRVWMVATLAEREACATDCEADTHLALRTNQTGVAMGLRICAETIRKRSN